jgi:hypothetical protein
MRRWKVSLGAAIAAGAMLAPGAEAVLVDSPSLVSLDADDFSELPSLLPAGSGLGLLDLVLLAPSGAGSLNNPAGPLNFDNSNTDMAAGATVAANESYLTSVGELREFYRLNFPDGSGGSTVDELLLMAQINQAGPLALEELAVVIDYSLPDSPSAQDPAASDVTATVQNATNGGFEAGTGTRLLHLTAPLPLSDLHAGPDYAVATGLNPFDPSLADGTRLLVNWRSSGHDGLGETLFLSGQLSPEDLCEPLGACGAAPAPDPSAEEHSPVPEPASWVLSVLGLGLTVLRRR